MAASGPDAERIEGYATAFLAVARAEGAVERVSDELFHFARALERNDALRTTITDQALSPEMRQGIVEEVLGSRTSFITTALVSFAVGAGRSRDVVAVIDRMVEKAAAEQQREVAEVRSSVPLDADQQARLRRALSAALGKQVDIKAIVDPSVMGGVLARVGDTVIDGTVRHRLEKLKEAL